MDDKFLLQLTKIGFKQSEAGSLHFELQGIKFIATIHSIIGLCLVVFYAGKGKPVQFKEYLPADSSTKDIANRILDIHESILPEEAKILKERFNRTWGCLRP